MYDLMPIIISEAKEPNKNFRLRILHTYIGCSALSSFKTTKARYPLSENVT